MNFLRRSAGLFADSFLLGQGRKVWAENEKNWNLRPTQYQKLLAGAYIISKDYSSGRFPPSFPDQQKAYEAEIECRNILPGTTPEMVKDAGMRKPFWYGPFTGHYLRWFLSITEGLRRFDIAPPAKILELGCGAGWAAEFLAQMGYDVVGTTISPYEAADAEVRIKCLELKELKPKLQFVVTPMEEVHEATKHLGPFDAVFVFEALHHAYDWRKTCASTFQSLKPGGWFLLCNEPNLLHTFIAYRFARLAHTHEIGFRKNEVRRVLRSCGFSRIVSLRNTLGFYFRPFWWAAQRPE